MTIVPQYEVRPISDDYVTEHLTYKYVPDPENPGKKMRVTEKVERAGGLLYTFPNGNSIRLFDKSQTKILSDKGSPIFGITDEARFFDDQTGLETNSDGVPLELLQFQKRGEEGPIDLPVGKRSMEIDTYESILAANGEEE